MKIIDRNTRLKDVLKNPVGYDLISRTLYSLNKSISLITKTPLGLLKLGSIPKLTLHKLSDDFVDALLKILNSMPDQESPEREDVEEKWWKEAVFYQIYPRSFADSNHDGIGDLRGIIDHLDYLKALGITALWICPVYQSPNDDNGYDVSDYYQIMPEFGTMADMDELLEKAHAMGIRIIMDLVLNHTSDEHEWFQKALSEKDSPYQDYYVFKDNKDNKEPNNWTSLFSGPAWNYYPQIDKWALHLFTKKQMDLNWDNPQLRRELYRIANWWLEKGVDGFRLDVISFISKDNYEDGDPTIQSLFGFKGIEHYFHGPKLDEYLQEFRRETFGNYDSFTVGECAGNGIKMSRMLTGDDRGELDTVFNFDHCENPGKQRFDIYEYDLRKYKPMFIEWQTGYSNHCWPTVFFENHDQPRMISKVDHEGKYHDQLAKLFATIMLTSKGVPFIYQGEEIGMTNVDFQSMADIRDVESINKYQELLAKGTSEKEAFRHILYGSRDHARTPMQWSSEENAGFSDGESWIMVNPNYKQINVYNQVNDNDSILNYYRRLITLRKNDKTLVYGKLQVLDSGEDSLVYYRRMGESQYLIEINLTAKTINHLVDVRNMKLLASNYPDDDSQLRPYQANVYQIQEGR